jgi:hypothetical protein
MSLLHPNAPATARRYIGTGPPLERLGWGIDGVVYTTPAHTTAVKVHSHQREIRERTGSAQAARTTQRL